MKTQLDLSDKLILAPMAGVTDIGFRTLASRFGADMTCSEMLSARAMLASPKKTALMTVSSSEEKVKIGQIFGHEPEIMAKATSHPLLAHYDIIDINMGCPAPKIFKNGEGGALMNNLPLAAKIISAVVKSTDRPVSVKFRLGVSGDNSLEFGKMCQEAGASFVTLHARTVQMGYSGKADLDAIARLKAGLKIAVVGNGDVIDQQSLQKMKATGVDSIMIGRASLGKPWIFDLLKGKNPPKDLFKVVQDHVEILRQHYDEKWLTLYMRKHFLWYVGGIEGTSEIRRQLATSPSLEQSLEILREILK